MLATLLAVIVSSGAPGQPADASPHTPPMILTAAERSDFARTSRYEEVVAMLDALAAWSPLATRLSLGTTVEGRDIPVLVLADPPVKSAAEARARAARDGTPVVLAIGNIHAGEVEGKEALAMLARDLLAAPDHPLLKRTILAVAPIYNADGNERLRPEHRAHQNGPREVGVRENARGRDLNRDFIKIEEPETRGLVRFLNEWDPRVFIDCHTTNGSFHRYALTYAGPKCPAGDAALIRYGHGTFFPALSLAFEAATGKRTVWYGNFEGEFGDGPRGHTRWESFPPEARYGTTYVGLRGRLSILSEAYVYDPFRVRVESTRDFVRLALELADANREVIGRLCREADQRAAGHDPAEGDDAVALRSAIAPQPEKIRILGFEETVVDGKSVRTDTPREYECELWDDFRPTLSVTRPAAYVLTQPAWVRTIPGPAPALEPIVAKLREHGIEVGRLKAPAAGVAVQAATVTGVTRAEREFQGHRLTRVETTIADESLDALAGTYVVRTDQPLGRLAVYLLEAAGEDSLATWNFLDPWLSTGAALPVYRVMRGTAWEAEPVP